MRVTVTVDVVHGESALMAQSVLKAVCDADLPVRISISRLEGGES